MALIGMAVYSTKENKKDNYLKQTLLSLSKTVDFNKHRLMLSVNSFTDETYDIIRECRPFLSKVFWQTENLGTAEAINIAWRERKQGEHCVKMDDDVIIYQKGWLDIMEEVVDINPLIGQVGLKRKDCIESPHNPDHNYKSIPWILQKEKGTKWIPIEYSKHIMGTCVLHSSILLDKVGFLYQPSKYGFDDVLMSYRSQCAGFKNAFIPQIEIDHIDPGDTQYQQWKHSHSGQQWEEVHNKMKEYNKGQYYYNPFK